MALPKLNETLNFEMSVPSTGKKVKYRPYLVKEEKVLLQAFESGDPKTCLEAMIDTIEACLDERTKIDVGSLATFDVEYMFVKVRSKSVGENSDLVIACGECKHENPVNVNLDEIDIDVSDRENVIPITENISVEMRYPTYEVLTKQDLSKIEKEDMDAELRRNTASRPESPSSDRQGGGAPSGSKKKPRRGEKGDNAKGRGGGGGAAEGGCLRVAWVGSCL